MGISLNYQTKIINITKPASKVTVQDLINTIRESECEVKNMSFETIIDTVGGKPAIEPTSYTPLTIKLSPGWQIQFKLGVGIEIIGGNVIGGVDGNPIKLT